MSFQLKVDVEYGEKTKNLFRRAAIRDCAKEAVKETTLEAESRITQRAPVVTGNLQSSIGSEIDGMEGKITCTAYYWVYVEYGTSKMTPRYFVTATEMEVSQLFGRNLIEKMKEKNLI